MLAATLLLALTIRTYDVVGIDARPLAAAEATSAAILQQVGVHTIWIRCAAPRDHDGVRNQPAECDAAPRADEMLVRIARAPAGRAGDTLGFAYVDTGLRSGLLATVYADRILSMADRSHVDVGTLLGRAIAHEIGHLLLGTTNHEHEGLMRATWTPALLQRRNARDWQFSAADREQLASRMRIDVSHANDPLAAIARVTPVAP